MTDPTSEEDRVLDLVASCPEGASYFTVTTELGIARTRAVQVLEKLHRDGKLSYDCKTKMYFPIARPPQDRLAAHERKIEAGLIEMPDPEVDRARPDRFPPEEHRNKCQFCGKVMEKYLWQHEQFCKENPNAKKAFHNTKREEPEGPSNDETSDAPAAVITDSTETIKEEPKEPETARSLLEAVVKDRPTSDTAGFEALTEPSAEGGIVTQPTLELIGEDSCCPVTPMVEVPMEPSHFTININGDPEKEAGKAIRQLYRQKVLGKPEEIIQKTEHQDAQKPKPAVMDSELRTIQKTAPLALFAQQHRVRVGREISKLRKVEKKLRRRAASAEAMADRVLAARRTKERELRRFEKELGEVSS